MGGSIVISKLDQWATDLLQLMGDAALPWAVMDWQRIVRQCEVPRFIMRGSVPHRCFGLGWLNKGLYLGDLCASPLLTEHVRLPYFCLSFALIQTNLDFVEDSLSSYNFVFLCYLCEFGHWVWEWKKRREFSEYIIMLVRTSYFSTYFLLVFNQYWKRNSFHL